MEGGPAITINSIGISLSSEHVNHLDMALLCRLEKSRLEKTRRQWGVPLFVYTIDVLAEERKQAGAGNKAISLCGFRVRPVGMGCVGHLLVGIV